MTVWLLWSFWLWPCPYTITWQTTGLYVWSVLCYYLKANEDKREGKELLFVSLNTGLTTDIQPLTILSWLEQTIQLCYAAANPATLQTLQVKAHDVPAFTASSAFYRGVSVEQILTPCHWHSHNIFTNFHLKELAWQAWHGEI